MQRTFAQQSVLFLGSLGPIGHLPASGTVTVAIAGLPVFYLTRTWGPFAYVAATTAFIVCAVWIHQAGDRLLGEKDSRLLVWDELAGFLVAVAFVPFTWQLVLLAFFLERMLDILKVPPARHIEDHWPGGLGVVGDDLIAGLYTCGVLHLLLRLAPGWLGAG